MGRMMFRENHRSNWRKKKMTRKGSITIMLALLLGTLLIVTGVTIDSARYFGSQGYLSLTGHNAAVMTFGNYNRELWEQYGLFGYRGFNGMSLRQWEEEFMKNMKAGLASKPTNHFYSHYANLYRIQELSEETIACHTLGEEKYFLKAVEKECTFLALKSVKTTGIVSENTSQQKNDINQSLEKEADLETGKYQKEQQEKEEQSDSSQKEMSDGEIEKKMLEDHAGGNPITFFRELLKNGILGLVCDTDSLSQEKTDTTRPRINTEVLRGEETTDDFTALPQFKDKNPVSAKEESTAGILKKIIGNDALPSTDDGITMPKDKAELIAYIFHYFPCETKKMNQDKRNAIEYLICGKSKDQDNLYQVVLQITMLRILVNYEYIANDAAWNAESLATATAIAGLLSCEPLIQQIQKTIQIIGAFEEACIDVAALLENREIPLLKNSQNFQLKYCEICHVSRGWYQSKAKNYPKSQNGSNKILQGKIDYTAYLLLFLWQQDKTTLVERCLDFIQDDLRKTKNQSFEINSCVAEIKCKTTYLMPLFSGVFGLSHPAVYLSREKKEHGKMKNSIDTVYGYH
jgi:hypothetical protein